MTQGRRQCLTPQPKEVSTSTSILPSFSPSSKHGSSILQLFHSPVKAQDVTFLWCPESISLFPESHTFCSLLTPSPWLINTVKFLMPQNKTEHALCNREWEHATHTSLTSSILGHTLITLDCWYLDLFGGCIGPFISKLSSEELLNCPPTFRTDFYQWLLVIGV